MPIISDAEMSSIARQFGPNQSEDISYLERHDPNPAASTNLFNTKPKLISHGPYGCRVIYVGNMTVRERTEAGQLATSGDYLVSLPAGTPTYTSDVLMITGKTWQAGERKIAGSKCSPVDNKEIVFMCNQTGNCGNIEPDWASIPGEGQQINDGTCVWSRIGPAQRYNIIQIAGPNTYSDKFSTKMTCTLRQKVVAK